MNEAVQGKDLDEVAKLVSIYANGGAKISDVVNALALNCHVPPSKARYIVRAALDKGKVRTDGKFRLHLTVPA